MTSFNDEPTIAMGEMLVKHILTPVIETTILKDGASVIASEIATYKILPGFGNRVVANKTYKLKQALPIPVFLFTESSVSPLGNFIFTTSQYYMDKEVEDYSIINGEPVGIINMGTKTSVVLNPNTGLPLLTAINADADEIAYASFEPNEEYVYLNNDYYSSLPGITYIGGWATEYWGVPSTTYNEAFTGINSYRFMFPSDKLTLKTDLNTSKNYTLTMWCKNGIPTITNSATTATITGSVVKVKNGWSLFQANISSVSNIGILGTTGCLIDDLKIRPLKSRAQSATYSPSGRIVSQCDENNHYTFYEYDEFNRLYRVYDIDKNVLKQYEYGIQETQN
jgi:hypothetical protein